MKKHVNVYLHTGTNLGDRESNLLHANQLIHQLIGPITKASGLYNTQAWGMEDQPDFLNQALCVQSKLTPLDVLKKAKFIEKLIGRTSKEKWGPRILDIDILFYENTFIDSNVLTLPHPHIQDRNFVLVPLNEIAADFIHPVLNLSINALLKACRDKQKVEIQKYL